MTPDQYQSEAELTEAPVTPELVSRLTNTVRALHGAVGCCTESGELQDALKKHIFYGKPLDVENVEEELGDMMWYIACICNALDLNLSEVMRKNNVKLRKYRYKDGFTEQAAIERADKE